MDYPKSVPSVGLVGGKFVDEDPLSGSPGSLIPAQWGNGVTEEVLNVITAAGMVPSETDNTQLRAAIATLAGCTGYMKNASLVVSVASASATFTASEVIVSSMLGGKLYRLSNFNQAVNLATVGAGGMDTGTAPASGFVALYAIYNPTSGARSILAVNATAAVQPLVYGGANMPAGFAASALISVLPTNISSQFAICQQVDNHVDYTAATALSTSAISATPTTFTTTVFPKNAKVVGGSSTVNSSAISAVSLSLYASDVNAGQKINNGTLQATGQQTVPFERLHIRTPQTIRYANANGAGTPAFVISISSYDF